MCVLIYYNIYIYIYIIIIILLTDCVLSCWFRCRFVPRSQMEPLMPQMMRAVNFAAVKHKMQRRKDMEETPYINHPIGGKHFIIPCLKNYLHFNLMPIINLFVLQIAH